MNVKLRHKESYLSHIHSGDWIGEPAAGLSPYIKPDQYRQKCFFPYMIFLSDVPWLKKNPFNYIPGSVRVLPVPSVDHFDFQSTWRSIRLRGERLPSLPLNYRRDFKQRGHN